MHRQTKKTAIPAKVKKAVALRDSRFGIATCILCGQPGSPNAHVIRRSQGGMGVEQNIICLCGRCHYRFDEGKDRDSLMEYVVDYLKSFYHDWTPESVKYKKRRD